MSLLYNLIIRRKNYFKLTEKNVMTTKPKTRSVKYDALKGICIYFVVCIHFVYKFFTPEKKPLSFEVYNYITGFAVPLFLVLGGFFFAKKYLSKDVCVGKDELKFSLRSLFNRIVIPYYIFVVILTCYNAVTGKSIFWSHFLFIDSNSHGLYYLIIYVYSFLWCLFIVFIFPRNVSKKYLIVLIPLISLIFFPIVFMHSNIHSVVFSQLPLISFFAIGIPLYFIQDYLEKNVTYCNYKTVLGTFLLIITLTAIIYHLRKIFGAFPVFVSAPPSIWILFYCAFGFLMAINILSSRIISQVVDKLVFVSFGANSLFIFLIHPYFIKVFIPIIFKTTYLIGLSISNDMFLLVILIFSYLTTMLSHFSIRLLPIRVRNIF